MGSDAAVETPELASEAECERQTDHLSVNASHENVLRKPDAGNLHVRFDEGRGGRGNAVTPLLLY